VTLLEYLLTHLGGIEAIDGLNLEVACLGWCLQGTGDQDSSSSPSPKSVQKSVAEKKVADTKPAASESKVEAAAPAISSDIQTEQSPAVEPTPELAVLSWQTVQDCWSIVLMGVRIKNHALEAVLRQAVLAGVEPGVVVLETEHTFHCEQLMSQKYRNIVETVLSETLQSPKVQIAVRLKPKAEVMPMVTGINHEDQLARAVEAAVLSLG
jgi:hypothetical protein